MTYEQESAEIGLNPDRADVIIPATRIYLNAMKWRWSLTYLCSKNWIIRWYRESNVLW